MDWTALEIEKALLRLEDSLPRMMVEHEDPRAFSAAVRRASADVESHAGDYGPYVSRRIDAMLVAMVRRGRGHDVEGASGQAEWRRHTDGASRRQA